MITINITQGGLGRQSANVDSWAGLFVEVDALPSNWTANEVKIINRPEDLETYGITATSANDNYKLVYWHVSELFRLAPDATLYLQLGVDASDGTTAETILTAFKNFEGRLRLFGAVVSGRTLASAEIQTFNTQMNTLFTSFAQSARCVVTMKKDAADAIPDFSSNDYDRIMVDIANDNTSGGLAATIFASAVGMCGAAGTFLGQLLKLRVHQQPSWRSFNIDGNNRWQTLGDINGDSVENKTPTEIAAYATQGVNLIVRELRLSGAYIANARMANDTSRDFAVINNGRVIDKAATLVYDSLVTSLNAPIYVNPANGQLTPEAVAQFQRAAWDAINTNMIIGKAGNDVELSVDLATGSLPLSSVYVDPNQNVLSTEQIVVQIRLVQVGAADAIVVNIGLTAQLN